MPPFLSYMTNCPSHKLFCKSCTGRESVELYWFFDSVSHVAVDEAVNNPADALNSTTYDLICNVTGIFPESLRVCSDFPANFWKRSSKIFRFHVEHLIQLLLDGEVGSRGLGSQNAA